ncbi:MAG TPA: cytochrome c biogenesis protein CcdA, partial [Candidatus Tectomicrobia bacterium]|nr:cytochrome c biogenesis protein CcdA [Candidatus Tectomicrobia bacterium]
MLAGVLAFAAGTLSLLSPCVLPLAPVVLTAALREHRFGPHALALGFTLSSTALGLAVALAGLALDRERVRLVAAVALVALGAV